MLQSQVNLDHRLAELRQVGNELRRAQAAREINRPARTVSSAIRLLLWGPRSEGSRAVSAAA